MDAEEQKITEEIMRVIAGVVENLLKEIPFDMGFALLVFEMNKPGLANYISNAQRKDMIKTLKETVERIESNEDIPATIGSVQ